MRAYSWALGLVWFVGAQSAQAAEGWKADNVTCRGAYGALAKQKDSLTILVPLVKDTANFASTDFAARAAALKSRDQALASSAYDSAADYQQNFEMMAMRSALDGDVKPLKTVLDLAARCDVAHGFKPILGPAGGAPPLPPPLPPMPPVRPPPPPVAAKPPVLPIVTDKSCAGSYLALSWGNGKNPVLAGALKQRADTAAQRYLAANPQITSATFITETRTAAETRLKAIIAKTAPIDPLFLEVKACDVKYGYGPPPLS